MEEKEFTYEIGGKTYTQRSLVLGQIKQLAGILESMSVNVFIDEMALGKMLINNVTPAIAVILTEKGRSPKDKDIEILAGELEFTLDSETMAQVIQDFFDCNPVALIYEKVSGMVKSIRSKMKTGSTGSVSSSPEGTLQSGTGSSGDLLPGNVSPGSTTDQGT